MELLRFLFKFTEATFRIDVNGVFSMLANIESLLQGLRGLLETAVQHAMPLFVLPRTDTMSYPNSRFLESLQTHFDKVAMTTGQAQNLTIIIPRGLTQRARR